MVKHRKTLGQVSYEGSGGPENFGTWDKCPQVVRDVHQQIGEVVSKEVRRRLRSEGVTKPRRITWRDILHHT